MNDREHAVLSLFYDEGNAELTPSFLAYRMRLTTRDATDLLDEMVKNGTLDLHFDGQGNITYRLPPGESQRIKARSQQAPKEAAPPAQASYGAGYGAGPGDFSAPYQGSQSAPDGTDATAGPAPQNAPGHQAIQGAQPAYDGTDGSVAPQHATPRWTSPQAGPANQGPTQNSNQQFYEDWYAAGDPPAASRQPRQQNNAYGGRGPLPDQASLTPYQTQQQMARARYGPPGQRVPILAGALSLMLPGLGQFYNGEFFKGIMLPIAVLFLAVFGLFWIVWIWSVIDAYMVAEQHNHRLLNVDGQRSPQALLPDQRAPADGSNSNAA